MKILVRLFCLLLCLALCLSVSALASGEVSDETTDETSGEASSESASGEASEGSGEATYMASSEGSSASIDYGYAGPASALTVSGAVNGGSDVTVIENKAILAVGGTAVNNAGGASLVVRNCVSVALDPAPTQPLTGNPGNLLVAGNVRGTLTLGTSHSYFINSTVLSTNWGALSTDAATPAGEFIEDWLSVYAYGTLARALDGGYGAYSDLFCNMYFYGSDIESAEIGVISGTYGAVTVGTIADGEAYGPMGLVLTEEDMAAQPDKEKGSVISGGRNALMLHSVSLPPYWQYEGYSQEELPLLGASISANGSTLKTDLDLNMGVEYDAPKQAYIDHTAGSVILIKSTNASLHLTGCELIPDPRGTGAFLQTVYNNDTMFMISVPDGESYPGIQAYLRDMDVTGDVIHEDYQRDLTLDLRNTTLTGAVNGYDCAHWNAVAAAEGFQDYALDASYATPHGVHVSLSSGSTWTVTAPSSISELTVQEGSSVIGSMTVNGVPTSIVPGTYSGDIQLVP